ncbi:PEPxxWA-CTERM sorting domain-containing protein [Sphingopyxis solisilvae]|uniref:PEPxxWA-CTERM sorting domain-containing protein n=1 Tax=Sphingopyxis solisilvae TaxID=1886788 RepID=UPI001892BEE6|nr:PEPxxWA-CTERM sorting domain-containing protein [Sphingopyxis solisilvae]
MRNLIKLTAAAALIGASVPASAAVTICLGGGCVANPDSNVLLNTGDTGTSVTGTLNNASGTVTLTSTESLSLPANGAARVTATDGVLNNPLTFTFNDGLISALEFNINALTNGDVFFTFSGGDSDGLVTTLYDLSQNGQNFFNAFNGTFQSVTMSFANGATVQDVRQFRMTSAAAVPEPATWALMLIGFGAIGFGMRRRRADSVRVRFA